MRIQETVIPFQIISLWTEGVHALVKANIGRYVARMIIDTGASRTVFDESFMLKVLPLSKVTPNGKAASAIGSNEIESASLVIPKWRIGECSFHNYEAAIIDLSHVNVSYARLGIKPVHGILGGDVLQERQARIHYKTKELFLSTQAP